MRGQARRVFTAVDAFDHEKDGAVVEHFILVAGDDALEARWFDLGTLGEANLAMSFGVIEVARQAATIVV